jgi:hypothetical protein
MEPATAKTDKKDATGLEAAMGTMDLGEGKGTRFAFVLDDEDKPDSSRKVVRSVRFPISRYEAYTHTLTFEPAATQRGALEAVQAYLDQPIERAYFDAVADDLVDDTLTWETLAADGYLRRGDLLTDLVHYEGFAAREGLEGAYDLLLGS